jgi:hypothetical protein
MIRNQIALYNLNKHLQLAFLARRYHTRLYATLNFFLLFLLRTLVRHVKNVLVLRLGLGRIAGVGLLI